MLGERVPQTFPNLYVFLLKKKFVTQREYLIGGEGAVKDYLC